MVTKEMKAFYLSLLAAVLMAATPCASAEPLCALPHRHYPLLPGLLFSQEIKEQKVWIELSYEGNAWLGFGWAPQGQMVGSTVVLGLPEDEQVAPFYLAARTVEGIEFVSTTSPTPSPVTRAPRAPTESRDDERASTDDGEWRRELQPIESSSRHRTLQLSDASLFQNDTHTVLRFARPLDPSAEGYPVLPVHENDFNTFIFAVGSDNVLGYHGTMRGSRSIEFAVTACAPNLAPSALVLDNNEQGITVEKEDSTRTSLNPDTSDARAFISAHAGWQTCISLLLAAWLACSR